jgi:LysR family transcriptional regulator, low CO2-responsive transcriptional regulator
MNGLAQMRAPGSDLTLHKLEVFRVTAELESVSRAAERLGLAQPVVTAHIRSLERKLGVRLTARHGRRIRITEQGIRVLVWATDVLTRTHELQRELSDSIAGRKGSVIVATSMSVGSYMLPQRLVDFRRKHPDVDIAVKTATPRDALNAIREGQADFAVSFLDPYYEMSGLDVVPVGIDELVLVGAARRAMQRSPLNLADIANLPFVTAQRQSARRMIEDSALLEREVVRKNIVLEFGHAEAIKRAVRCDMGLAFLFRCSISDELAMGSLRVVPVKGLDIEAPICLTRRRDKYLSPSQSALYDYLRSGGLTGREQERDEGPKPVRSKTSDRR